MFHATTVLAVRHGGQTVMASDGQVTFGDTVMQEYRMRDLQKAFEAVLDHPDAAEALSHPALAPLLDFAAD